MECKSGKIISFQVVLAPSFGNWCVKCRTGLGFDLDDWVFYGEQSVFFRVIWCVLPRVNFIGILLYAVWGRFAFSWLLCNFDYYETHVGCFMFFSAVWFTGNFTQMFVGRFSIILMRFLGFWKLWKGYLILNFGF